MFWFLSGNHHWPFTKLLKGFVCTPTVSFGVNLLSQHKLLGEWCEQAGQWQVHGNCSGNSAEANNEHLMGGKVFSASAISKAFSDCVLMGNFDSSHFWIHKSHSFFRSIWSLGLFFFVGGSGGEGFSGFSVPWGLPWIPLFVSRVQVLFFIYTEGAVFIICKMSQKIKEVWKFQGRNAWNQLPLCSFQPLTLWRVSRTCLLKVFTLWGGFQGTVSSHCSYIPKGKLLTLDYFKDLPDSLSLPHSRPPHFVSSPVFAHRLMLAFCSLGSKASIALFLVCPKIP